MMTTVMMMMTSAKSISPWMAPVTALMMAATISMMTIGSAICWKKRIHSGVFSASSSLFGPNFSCRLAASAELRPASTSVPCSRRTSSDEDKYSFIRFPLLGYLFCGRQIDARS